MCGRRKLFHLCSCAESQAVSVSGCLVLLKQFSLLGEHLFPLVSYWSFLEEIMCVSGEPLTHLLANGKKYLIFFEFLPHKAG